MAEKLSREAFARKEIGSTEVSRGMSIFLSGIFLLIIFLIPLVQHTVVGKGNNVAFVVERADGEPGIFRKIKTANVSILKAMNTLETELEEESFLRSFFLPPLQTFLYEVLHEGNDKVVAGKDGWLFYRPGIDSVTGPPFLDREQLMLRSESHEQWEPAVQPDPVRAIVDFKNQLAQRGVDLVVLPVPVKPSINPEKLSDGNFDSTPVNRSWSLFLQEMEKNGVDVIDLYKLLGSYATDHGAAFLQTDTHWLPGSMERVARVVAKRIDGKISYQNDSVDYLRQKQAVKAIGDIAKMLTMPSTVGEFYESVEIDQVVSEGGELWQPATSSEILLLGDSFTNIYSTASLGWGRSGGLAEQLSYYLKQPLDLLARNDSGAFVTRQMLAKELARGRDRLEGKKLVVWEFAARELSLGDWKMIDMLLGSPSESSFLAVEPGNSVEVEGTVSVVSKSPKPGSVPYLDNIITLHLVDLEGKGGGLESDQALVYTLGMRNNKLTEAAGLRPGDQVRMQLTSWDEVESEYGSFRRSPLDDEILELELPNWGVLEK